MKAVVASVLLLGFGMGLAVGTDPGSTVFALGAVLVVVAVGATAVTTRRTLARTARVSAAAAPDGPGTRVEQLLRLAEEQAADHIRQAEREAEQVLAAAYRQARSVTVAASEPAGPS
jgi:hypothetical protein